MDGLRDHLRDIVLLLLLVNFVRGFRLEIMYISFIVNIKSSPTHFHGFLLFVCAAAIGHINHFFGLYQQNKSSRYKVKFRQVSNYCKSILEAAKLAYANKIKESIRTFDESLVVFSTKLNLLYTLYSRHQRCCLLHLIKQKCLLKF